MNKTNTVDVVVVIVIVSKLVVEREAYFDGTDNSPDVSVKAIL